MGSETFPSGNPGGRGSEDGGGLARYEDDYGMGGDAGIIGMGRHVTVAPHDPATSLRHLDFKI